MTEAERQEIAALIRARITQAVEDDARARRAEADIDLSDFCVGGKLDRTEAQVRHQAARAAAARRQALRSRLDAALARSGRRDFGTCAACGEPIPLARLRVDPTVSRCRACSR